MITMRLQLKPGVTIDEIMPPPRLVKIGQKKMATECGGLYFMFRVPPLLRSFWIRYCEIFHFIKKL